MALRGKSNNLDNCINEVKPYGNICSCEISKQQNISNVVNKSFMIGDYVAATKFNLLVRGYVDFYGGYASHTREVINGLHETSQYNIKLNPLRSPIDIDPIDFSRMNWFVSNPAFSKKKYVYLSIAGPGYLQKEYLPKTSKLNIGWTMIETVGVQPEIVEWCNNVELLFAPTQVDVNKFINCGLKNTELMRIGYDSKLYNSRTPRMDIVNCRNRYVFGVVGSWNHRKGVEQIVTSYCQEFNKKDPVVLLLLCKYGNRPYGEHKDDCDYWGIKYELNRLFEREGFDKNDCPQISVIDVPLYPTIMAATFNIIDCVVGFSSGESTWLPGLEALALGKPVIQLANKYAGYMDYLNDNRYMCRDTHYRECDERLYEGTSEYYKNQKMAFGNVEELKSLLRNVYMERGSILQSKNTDKLQNKIQHYSWKESVNCFHERLKYI